MFKLRESNTSQRLWLVLTVIWIAIGSINIAEYHPDGMIIFIWRWIGIPFAFYGIVWGAASVADKFDKKYDVPPFALGLGGGALSPFLLSSVDNLLTGRVGAAFGILAVLLGFCAFGALVAWILFPVIKKWDG